MAPIKFGVGQSVLRKEDDALIRGKGRYTDDHAPQPALHALMLRSPHAHAKFTIDTARARGLPGVALILTGEDVRDLGDLPCLFNLEVNPFTGPPYPILPKDEVRHVGDAVAFVVADTVESAWPIEGDVVAFGSAVVARMSAGDLSFESESGKQGKGRRSLPTWAR